jgi:hypothetical protein
MDRFGSNGDVATGQTRIQKQVEVLGTPRGQFRYSTMPAKKASASEASRIEVPEHAEMATLTIGRSSDSSQWEGLSHGASSLSVPVAGDALNDRLDA